MTWTDKGFVNVNFGIQAGSPTVSVNTPFELYGETGSVDSTMEAKARGFFEVAGGYKVWSNLAVGIGYSYGSGSSDAAVTASVPDPLFFDQQRVVTTTASDIKHSQSALHLTGTWMVPKALAFKGPEAVTSGSARTPCSPPPCGGSLRAS